MPFQFKRRQFPLQLAYCMTIHKSQGQSFEKMGIYIDKPLFTHGQLYVALSRVGKAGGVFMHILDDEKCKTKYADNVIYYSALQSEGYRIIPQHNQQVSNIDSGDDSVSDTSQLERGNASESYHISSSSDSDSDFQEYHRQDTYLEHNSESESESESESDTSRR